MIHSEDLYRQLEKWVATIDALETLPEEERLVKYRSGGKKDGKCK